VWKKLHSPYFYAILPQAYTKLQNYAYPDCEDDDSIRDGLLPLHRQQGYAVDYVSDGQDADLMLRARSLFIW